MTNLEPSSGLQSDRRSANRASAVPRRPARLRAATALILALLAAGTGAASHMSQYTHNPVAHDDLGRSNEPDFASTGVLGPQIGNCVVDLGFNGRCDPDALLPAGGSIAPGCTVGGGWHPSGFCGLMTVGIGTAAVPFSPVNREVAAPLAPGDWYGPSPGRFDGARVRFLDARADVHVQGPIGGVAYVDGHNRAVAAISAAYGIEPTARPHLLGSAAMWAWFGDWEDKNGNGVIDHLTYACGGGATCASAYNEFVWRGRCLGFDGQFHPEAIANGVCAYDDTTGVDFVYPGTYKATVAACLPLVVAPACLPSTLPGNGVLALAGGFVACPDADACLAPNLRDQDEAGDPVLGGPGGAAPDEAWHDRTGEPADEIRQWVRGTGWATPTYDAGLLTTAVVVTAFGCRAAGADVLLESCRFTDVDRYDAVNPLTEALLTSEVRPLLSSQWAVVKTAASSKFLPPETFSTDPCEGYEDAIDDAGAAFVLMTVVTANGCEALASSIVAEWHPLGGADENDVYMTIPKPYACGRLASDFDNILYVPEPAPGSTIQHVYGTPDDDLIYGTMSTDYIHGGDGDDCIFGFGGNDFLYGGNGDDWIFGGSGIDTIYGDLADGTGTGADHLYGGHDGDHLIDGGAGDDALHGGDGDDTMWGGPGNDDMWGDDGDDYLGGDEVLGAPDAGDDDLYGGSGNDSLYGGGGMDSLSGDDGADHLDGGPGFGDDEGNCGFLDGATDTFQNLEVAYYCP